MKKQIIKMITITMITLACSLTAVNISKASDTDAVNIAVTPSAIEVKPTPTPSTGITKKLTKAEKRKLIKSFKKDIKLKDKYTHKGTYVCYINNMQGAKLTNTSKASQNRMSVVTKGNKIILKVKKDGMVRLKLQYKGNTIPLDTRVKLTSNLTWAVNCSNVVLNKVGDKHKIRLLDSTRQERKRVRYKESNRKVATVSKTGVITAKGKGRCTVTVKIGNRKVKIAVIVKSGATVGETVGTGTASVSLNSGASVKAETPKATPKPKATQASKNNKAAKAKAEEEAKKKAAAKKKAEAVAKKKAEAKKSNNNTKKNTKSSSTSNNKNGIDISAMGETHGTLQGIKQATKGMSKEALNREIKTN